MRIWRGLYVFVIRSIVGSTLSRHAVYLLTRSYCSFVHCCSQCERPRKGVIGYERAKYIVAITNPTKKGKAKKIPSANWYCLITYILATRMRMTSNDPVERMMLVMCTKIYGQRFLLFEQYINSHRLMMEWEKRTNVSGFISLLLLTISIQFS